MIRKSAKRFSVATNAERICAEIMSKQGGVQGHRMGEKTFINIGAVALFAALACASVAPASAQSLTDRFKSLFGGSNKDDPPPVIVGEPKPELNCPQVTIRYGASTYAVAAPGKQAVGNDVRYQASIGKLARECIKAGGEITAHIGIQGRVIAGPAGAPQTVEVPLRVAVVQGGVGEKVIATKAYRTTVNIGEEESVPFSFVADDLVYPAPPGAVADNYIFYVGFDPQLVSSEPKAKAVKKKK